MICSSAFMLSNQHCFVLLKSVLELAVAFKSGSFVLELLCRERVRVIDVVWQFDDLSFRLEWRRRGINDGLLLL